MKVRTPKELGLVVRDHRKRLGMTQAQLASVIGSSRQWIRLLESGRPRVELGLTLRALNALDLTPNIDDQSEAVALGQ